MAHDLASDEEGAGEPIPELAALREQPSRRFMDRVRSSIQRRVFASDTVDFSIMVFFRTMFEYLTLALTGFAKDEPKKKDGE